MRKATETNICDSKSICHNYIEKDFVRVWAEYFSDISQMLFLIDKRLRDSRNFYVKWFLKKKKKLYIQPNNIFLVFLSRTALELRIKRENFIAAEMVKNHKEKTGRREPRPDDDRHDLTLSGRDHANSSV